MSYSSGKCYWVYGKAAHLMFCSSAGNVARTDAIVKIPGWTDVIASSHYGRPTICSSSISTSRTSS